MKYIMVTDFENHWDNIEKNFTSYTSHMIKKRIPKNKFIPGTNTIFIKKVAYSDRVEKAWSGKIWDIEHLGGKVYFRVEIGNEIQCPQEYTILENGWYIE